MGYCIVTVPLRIWYALPEKKPFMSVILLSFLAPNVQMTACRLALGRTMFSLITDSPVYD